MSADHLALAEETYQNAVALFKTKYTTSSDKKKWLSEKSTLHDVENVLLVAKERYDVRTNSRARKYINQVSAGIMYYANIMDMLVQHHPEYVSLGWGTMKLIFVLVLNHEELVTELAKALAKVSDTLPQTQLHLVLYPTAEMKRVVEELYALLMLFYQRALRWYQASRLKHIARALIKPFRLEFGDLIERINSQARLIESLAITMAHQEIRSIYALVQDCLSEQKALRLEQNKVTPVMTEAQQLQTQTLQLLISMQQMLLSHQTVNSGILLTTQRMTRETQVTLMIAATSLPSLLAPNESLRRRIASCSRRQVSLSMHLDGFLMSPTLKAWASETKSSLLIVSGTLSTRLESLIIGTYTTELIRSSKTPVLWALKGFNGAKCTDSTSELFKYLTMQALQLDPSAVGERVSQNFNAALVASATSGEDWLKVLGKIASVLPTLFIIIEADLLGRASRDELQIQEFLRLLQGFVREHTTPPIRIAFFNYRRARITRNGTSASQNDRTHTLFLNKLMQAATHQRKVVKLVSELRRQHAATFRQRIKKQASITVVGSDQEASTTAIL
ncbi:hypothetical protein EV356DRAFT_518019 [Viridothelium virens]|uniref:DUF7708 domain-containing protein n=1 Tax=Viridothelium virens TaxID=1048519 RepID=A0A6A6H1L8_VIRVR|nr:hypothetical protein EV356DRAFT_518019 [Viridothelium virens]